LIKPNEENQSYHRVQNAQLGQKCMGLCGIRKRSVLLVDGLANFNCWYIRSCVKWHV